jgi:hypothetical protein
MRKDNSFDFQFSQRFESGSYQIHQPSTASATVDLKVIGSTTNSQHAIAAPDKSPRALDLSLPHLSPNRVS